MQYYPVICFGAMLRCAVSFPLRPRTSFCAQARRLFSVESTDPSNLGEDVPPKFHTGPSLEANVVAAIYKEMLVLTYANEHRGWAPACHVLLKAACALFHLHVPPL